MSKGRAPSIFVSSTCFDLGQIRRDMKECIENLGHDAILSEYDTFPIDPVESTIESCLRAVENRADIFVLIIGGRYGSLNEEGKSITNLEYLKARSMGIPIYVFVQQNILSILPVWKDNRSGDFTKIVDSPKLFEFVESIMSVDSRWIHSFNGAQDIVQTLKRQLAYLFSEALGYLKLINNKAVSNTKKLDGEALRLVLDRPKAWEYKLFAEVLTKGIKNCEDIRQDMRYGITFYEGKSFSNAPEFINWIMDHCNKLDRIVSNLNILFNEALQIAMGEPGVPGDPDHIIYATNKIVDGYKQSIVWCLECNSIAVDRELQPLLISASGFSFGIVDELEKYSMKVKNEIEKIRFLIDGQTLELDLTFSVYLHGYQTFNEEMEKLREKYVLELL